MDMHRGKSLSDGVSLLEGILAALRQPKSRAGWRALRRAPDARVSSVWLERRFFRLGHHTQASRSGEPVNVA
jgi:hypothetical protein